MTKRRYLFILPVKILCLALSIFFLRQWLSEKSVITNNGMNTVLIIDRESSEIDTYKDSAVSYITAHPTSAFGLVSYASGEFTLILPATTNSSIIIAYIQSIAPAGSVTDAPSTLPEYLRSTYSQYMVFTDSNNIQKLFADKPLASLTDNEYTEWKTKNIYVSSLLFLLALFL